MYSILIVDDEPMVRLKLKTLLPWEEHGFTVCATASNGAEALELVNKFHPQIILTDLKMPVMGGLELIGKLRSQHYGGQILILSNYSDFEYVRQGLRLGAFDYILKISLTAQELLQQLQQCAKLLPANQASSECTGRSLDELLLKTYLQDSDFSISELQSRSSVFTTQSYYLCYVSQPGKQGFFNRNGKAIAARQLHTIVLETFHYLPETSILSMTPNASVIIIPAETLSEIALSPQDFAMQLSQYSTSFLAMQLFIFITKQAYPFHRLKAIYQKCRENEDISFYIASSPICLEDINRQGIPHLGDYKQFAYDLVEQYFRQGQFTDLPLFDQLVKQCIRELVPPMVVKGFMEHIYTYISIMTSRNETAPISAQIKAAESIHQLSDIMYTFFHCCAPFFSDRQSVYRKEITQCIQFIHNHYQEELSLDRLADKVGISKNYLCKIFKEDVQVSVVQYINNYRMEQAAQLILNSDMLLKEIADHVGIHDQFYFNRVFKKTYDMTPSEYKQQHVQ